MITNNIKGFLLLAKFDDNTVKQMIIDQDKIKYCLYNFIKVENNEAMVTDVVGIDFEIPEKI